MIEVRQSGTRLTIQDAGRPGHRHEGIPRGGAADKLSFALANFMVGNPWDTPALECVLGGQHFRFQKDMTVAIAGAEMWAQVNGQNVENCTSFKVKSGDILTFSFARTGCRAYLAIPGGFSGDEFLGSVSTYLPAGLGGFDGRALQSKDILEIKDVNPSPNIIPTGYKPFHSNHIVLRALEGPEFYELSLSSQRHLFIDPYRATQYTNRMGARLKGNLVVPEITRHMISSPLLPGTLQCPPDGQPILAMTDGHCTGGYLRALQVIRADLWLMGQIKPGTKISFKRSIGTDSFDVLARRNAFYGNLIEGFSF
ncbi:MAG: biotin-dependent carboxyltransferase family protein [Hellea sp.]|nr:biotin-dependent carboxyltransferase family protein [Hellea sp.]